MRTASALRRFCAYPNVLSRITPRSDKLQAACDKGTEFHRVVKEWAEGRNPVTRDDEVRGWLELFEMGFLPPPKDALYEFPMGLGPLGTYVPVTETEPHVYSAIDGQPLLTAGRADAVWVHDRIVRVADWKTGAYAVDPPGSNLQLLSLGFAAASMLEAEAMELAVYYARDGAWVWSDVIPLDSEAAADAWAEVEAAALLDDSPRPGVHCEPCWERRTRRCKHAAQPEINP